MARRQQQNAFENAFGAAPNIMTGGAQQLPQMHRVDSAPQFRQAGAQSKPSAQYNAQQVLSPSASVPAPHPFLFVL